MLIVMDLYSLLLVLIQVTASLVVTTSPKKQNVRVFNLMAITNETRHIKGYEMCQCFNANVD